MTRISGSHHGVVPGSKSEELRVNFDSYLTLIFDVLKNNNKSKKLIEPLVLESLLEGSRAELNQINWETYNNESNPRKSQTTLDTQNVKDEAAFNIKKEEAAAVFELKESIGKHMHESKCKVTLNEAQSIKNFNGSEEVLMGNERSPTLTKSPNKSKRGPGRPKLKSKKDDGNGVETSASEKKKEIDEARKDFSIENLDKDKNNYKKECDDILSCFTADGYDKAYTYLLLDPRLLYGKSNATWHDFYNSIFYIGKGTDKRALKHGTDAEKWLKNGKPSCREEEKFKKIIEIWESENPYKIFKITEGITDNEALTREAAMIDAIGVDRLCNDKRGTYHKKAKYLEAKKCLELGGSLLVEAWDIFNGKNPNIYGVMPKNDIILFDRIMMAEILKTNHERDFKMNNKTLKYIKYPKK